MRLLAIHPIAFLVLPSLLSQYCSGHDVPFAHRSQPTLSENTALNSSQHKGAKVYNSTNSSTVPLASGSRPVYLIMHVRLTGAQTFPPTYDKLFPVYASLHFNASSTDGPLEVQLVNQDSQNIIRVTDWGLHNSDKPMGVPQSGYLTDYFELFGKTNATNDQILNPSTGRGLIHEVWSRNTSLALKAYNSIDFMHACIAHLGLGLAPSDSLSAVIPTRIALAQTYWRNLWVAEKIVSHYPIWLETLEGWGNQMQKSRAEFDWQVGAEPRAGMVHSHPVPVDQASGNFNASLVDNGISDLAAPEMTETYLASNNTLETAPDFQYIYAQPMVQNKVQRRDPPTVADQYLVVNPGDDYPVIGQKLEDGNNKYAVKESSNPVNDEAGPSPDGASSSGDGGGIFESDAVPPANDVVSPSNRITNAVIARVGDKPILTFVRSLYAVGAASALLAIVIADLTKPNDTEGALCGIMSITTSIMGFFAYFGPPAIAEVLMLAAVIIGEVPNFSKSRQPSNSISTPPSTRPNAENEGRWKRGSAAPTPPLRTDVRGILQYTIVGDRNQTGNEKCISKGYKNCTVVYGPYLLAAALQVETFDAFALLIHYNEGYPMSMADLVKAFTLATDPDSANQVATIDCSHSSRPNFRYSWSDPNQATILQECDTPIFSINRKLVNLPILDQTADLIYNRLMPQGNCSLVGDVTGGEKYPAYNITIRGGAVAIACGIVGAVDMNGTASPLPDAPPLPTSDQSTPLSLISPGNQSSDGSSGRAYLAPPPTAPFQTTLNLTNSICMSAPSGSSLWFPNGTYSSQGGSLGFDSSKANTLTLDANSSLVITESTRARSKGIYAHAPAPPPTYIDHLVTYKTNQSAADTDFSMDMQNMIKYKKDNTFTVNVPTEPDVACFYQQPMGKGDFACFGPGGGDLPAGLKGKTRSVKAFGRVSVEVFANNYGNSFAHIIDTYEDDLAGLPYDKQSSFADVAASIWVYLEPGPMIPTDPGPPTSGSSSPGPSAQTLKAVT